jgi:hypothetical protein
MYHSNIEHHGYQNEVEKDDVQPSIHVLDRTFSQHAQARDAFDNFVPFYVC